MLSIRSCALLILACLVPAAAGMASIAEINGVQVVPADGAVRIEIGKVGNIEFKAFTMSDPERLVIDCIGAKYDVKKIADYPENDIVKSVRTSQFRNEPVMISRIVIDLKRKVEWQMSAGGDFQVVELSAPAKGAQTAVSAARPLEPVRKAGPDESSPAALTVAAMGPVLPFMTPDRTAGAAEPQPQRKPAADSPWATVAEADSAPEPQTEPASEATPAPPVAQDFSGWERQLRDEPGSLAPDLAPAAGAAARANWTQPQYVRGAPAGGGGIAMGQRKITLDAQGADIKTVLRTISDFAGVNIVAGKDVKGEMYVHIKDTPWEEALDIMLRAYGYGYRNEYGMIRVSEMTQLMRDELEEKTADRRKEELLPLLTRIVFVNYSNAKEIRMALENVLSQRGTISVDEGSNALIVMDIEKNVEKIESMVRELDRRLYQVDINAKLVEIDVEAAREMGIDWNLFNLHKSGFSGTGSAAVSEKLPLSSSTLKFGSVRSWGELNSMLQMLERTNKANIISNPRITTMDNREARIMVGKEIPLIVADEAGNPITELTKIGIMLIVTPRVNSDRTITLDLHPEVSELQAESTAQGGVIISTSEADTRVIVANGETAVIGGLIKEVETEVVRGVPVLKDIPYLGLLFSSRNTVNKKQELVIFVTPTIVE